MSRIAGLLALLALALFGTAAQAEAPLTVQEVRGFADSLSDVENIAARLEQAGVDLGAASEDVLANPMSAAVQQMRAQRVLGEFEAALRRHGFADAEHWSRIGDRVFRAYFALAMERQAVVAEAEMKQALADLDDNPHISPEQKRAMRQMMNGTLAAMQVAVHSSEADKAAVAPHVPLIERAWKLGEDEDEKD